MQQHGLLKGLALSLVMPNLRQALIPNKVWHKLARGIGYHWVFATPTQQGLDALTALVELRKVRPSVDRTWSMADVSSWLQLEPKKKQGHPFFRFWRTATAANTGKLVLVW